ncbi:MAG TPA: hypothetical protein VF765_17305 [Polyangiaceae bacterium]
MTSTRVVLDELVEAAGGLEAIASDCEVPTRTVLLWLTGASQIPLEMRLRLTVVAIGLGMWEPPPRSRSGLHCIAPAFVLKTELPRRVRHAE